MQAIVTCLAPLADRVHTGSTGTGQTINCCSGDDNGKLLRVEDAGFRAPEGAQPLARHGCRTVITDITVTFAECFQSHTRDGGERSIEDLTADAMNRTVSVWDAFNMLSCCERDPVTGLDAKHLIRFQASAHQPPEGGCVTWTMNLEADVYVCACHGAWGDPE